MTPKALAALAAAHVPHRLALRTRAQAVQTSGALQSDAAQGPASPCIGVCQLDATQQYCVGCLRNVTELQAWGRANTQEQLAIWAQILDRAEQLQG